MLVDRYEPEDVFARVPEVAAQTAPVLNDRVVELARQAKVATGRKLRLDATCVQATVHHPPDSGLLIDSGRVLSRLVKRAKPLVAGQLNNVGAACPSRLRSARRAAQTLHRLLRRKSETKEQDQRALYQKLIETGEQMVRQTERVVLALQQQSETAAKRLREQAEQVVPLVKRVIAQTRSRVLEGKKVASADKALTLFEPHPPPIPPP